MDGSTPGFPVHHQPPESTQTHVLHIVITSNHLILCRPHSSCLQSFPASGSIQMSQLFARGGQNVGVSVSTSVLPMDIQSILKVGSPCSPKDSQESSPTPQGRGASSKETWSLPCVKQPASRNLLCDAGAPIRSCVPTWRGGTGWETGGRFRG